MFKFSLQPVLEHRMAIEDKRQGELKEVLNVMIRLEAERAELRSKQVNECAAATESTDAKDAMAYRQLVGEWIVWANVDIERIEREMAIIEFETDRRRKVLAEAAKATMSLDKLKEKEEAEHHAQDKREEQKLFDELALREFSITRRAEKLSAERKGMHDEA